MTALALVGIALWAVATVWGKRAAALLVLACIAIWLLAAALIGLRM